VRVLGCDGARGGWIAVALDDGRLTGVRLASAFTELVADPASVIGVDIPLGETVPGDRAAERAARRYLGPRCSTIFTPPPLAAAVDDYAAARRAALDATGKSISKQAWHLLPKMLDAVPHWRRDPRRLREVHPECAFAAMAGAPLTTRKRTDEGRAERLALLAAQGITGVERAPVPRGARPDDVVDAAAVAWTAHRVATGLAHSLPDPPELDAAGRPVAVWC
jgi:predicted RNase H-like nuclease